MAETTSSAATTRAFNHLQDQGAPANGPKRMTECGVYVRAVECVRRETVTCPVCLALMARQNAEDLALEQRAAARGMTVQELLFGAEDDPRDWQSEWPSVPR